MEQIRIEEVGGPEVLRLHSAPTPEPGPGEILVDVAAAGVNYIDTYHRSGLYQLPLPFVPGQEGAGTVTAVGEGVNDVRPGDRVAWQGVPGSYSEQAVIPATRAVPVPAGVGDDLAAATLLQGVTAHYLATDTFPIKPGDIAVVHAAAGGVGLLLTQIVTLRGGRVIATVSTEEKAALAREAGAGDVVLYTEVDFAAEVRRLTDGRGADVVYDGVGQSTFDKSLESLRPRGMMVLYGAASGPVPPFDIQRLNSGGSLFLTRPTTAHYVATREELLRRAGDLFGWIASGELTVRIGGRYKLADAAQAHLDLQGRKTTDKLILQT